MTILTANGHLLHGMGILPPIPHDFSGAMTIDTNQAFFKMDIRGQAAGIKAIDQGRLFPVFGKKTVADFIIPFCQAHIIHAYPMSIVTGQALLAGNRFGELMAYRVAPFLTAWIFSDLISERPHGFVFALTKAVRGIGHMAGRTTLCPPFSMPFASGRMEMTAKTASPQQVID